MKRLAIFYALTLTISAIALRAQTPTCSNATLSGSYGISLSGTWAAPSVLPNSIFTPGYIEQLIGVVLQVFDGQGNFSQTNNIKGTVSGINANQMGAGTYTINSNCTGTYTLNVATPIVTQIVIVKSGTEFRGVVVSPQIVMVSVNGSKM